jgi:hypothetical protein
LNDALDSTMNPDHIQQIFQTIDVIIKSGIDLVAFAKILIDTVKATETPKATIRDAKTNKAVVTVDPNSRPEDVASKLKSAMQQE